MEVSEVYEWLCYETRGHYHVGIDPEKFLDGLLPWNETTPSSHKQKAPSDKRVASLRSVPPEPGQLEGSMYAPFVDALDYWVDKNEQIEGQIQNPQTLRFLHSPKPDASVENFNVDVSTYWEDDFPRCTTFSCQQTHEVFKLSVIHDAFQHELDEGQDAEEDGNEFSGQTGDSEGANAVEKGLSETHKEGEGEDGEGIDGEDDGQQDEGDEVETLETRVEVVDDVPKPIASRPFETKTEFGCHTRGQIAVYAGLALSMNFRKHFFSTLFLGRYARFIRWDRCGAIVTRRFDYVKHPELVFDFYRRYGQLTLIQRGFDPTATRCKLPKPVVDAFKRHRTAYGGDDFARIKGPSSVSEHGFRVTVEDAIDHRTEDYFIPPPRYHKRYLVPFPRGTKRSLACLYQEEDERPVEVLFFKDSWQEDSPHAVREADVYRRLKVAEVQYVASMRLGGDVDDMVTESQDWMGKKFIKMVCHRLVLETVARSLSTFTWCKVLLSCIADAVEAVQQAYKAGILHRDLSAGNIMIVRDEKTHEWRGILIDWDMCLLLENREGETRSGRTGTWAFMSAKIQSTQGPYIRTLCDDLESAFWVLLYHALLYMKHNLTPNRLALQLNAIFSSHILESNGSAIGGPAKVLNLGQCYLGESASSLAAFEKDGLSDLVDDLGKTFYERYKTKNKTSSKTQKIPIDLDDCEDTWFTTVLRETALTMGPTSVTPKALESPANNSKPPDDPEQWKRAALDSTDFYPMPWVSNPQASDKMQVNQFERITSSMVHHLDGLSSKRRYIEEQGKEVQEDKPAPKKQRQESPTPNRRRSQRLNHLNPTS